MELEILIKVRQEVSIALGQMILILDLSIVILEIIVQQEQKLQIQDLIMKRQEI
jgi:hypothetical protein